MMTPVAQSNDIISFGPLRVVARERLVTKDGVPVELSPRAFDILLALVSQPAEVVSKGDLIAILHPPDKVRLFAAPSLGARGGRWSRQWVHDQAGN